MPRYYKNPMLTEEAFDEEGFYCIGDAGKLEDPLNPIKGIVFDGRVSENFKLSTGTWVSVGNLRTTIVACAGNVIQDLVLTGHDRDEIGVLVFPNVLGCRALCPELAVETPVDVLIENKKVPSGRAKLPTLVVPVSEREGTLSVAHDSTRLTLSPVWNNINECSQSTGRSA